MQYRIATKALRTAAAMLLCVSFGCVRWPEPTPDDPRYIDPLHGHHTPGKEVILPNNAVLRAFFDGAGVTILDRETAADVPAVLRNASAARVHLIVARNIRAHDVSEEAVAMLRDWVREGGVLWLRSNSSLETFFGVRWEPRKRYYTLNRLLVRDDGQIINHPLTRGVRRVWITGLGVYRPVSPLAVKGWEDVLVGPSGCLFGVLHYGKGCILFDSSTVDPEERNPFIGIYGFDADVFWTNVLIYVGIIQPAQAPGAKQQASDTTSSAGPAQSPQFKSPEQ